MDQYMPTPPVEMIAQLEHVIQIFDFLIHMLRAHEAAVGRPLALHYPAGPDGDP